MKIYTKSGYIYYRNRSEFEVIRLRLKLWNYSYKFGNVGAIKIDKKCLSDPYFDDFVKELSIRKGCEVIHA